MDDNEKQVRIVGILALTVVFIVLIRGCTDFSDHLKAESKKVEAEKAAHSAR